VSLDNAFSLIEGHPPKRKDPPSKNEDGAPGYFHANGLGSITSISSAAGSIANTYTYDSYGNLTASTGRRNENRKEPYRSYWMWRMEDRPSAIILYCDGPPNSEARPPINA